MASSGKYTDLWTKQIKFIKDKLNDATTKQSIQLNSEDFNKVGNRSNYSFNLEFVNGIVRNNIGGSAVARDLAQVLENINEIKEILKTGHYKINIDRQFCLCIERK
jgi:plasmid maintenance system killer protein